MPAYQYQVTSAVIPSRTRENAIDGLRGLAIVYILALHFVVYPVARASPDFYVHYLRFVGGHFWAGVDLFFVLSGYLIASSLLKDRRHEEYYARYFVRRAFRILPLYLVLLGGFVLLTFLAADQLKGSGLLENSYPLIAYSTFTQNFLLARSGHYGGDLLAATWSLAIEVQFYLLIPFLVRYLRERELLAICGAAIVLSTLARVHFPYPASYAYPFCRGDGLFMGVAVAVIWNGPHAAKAKELVRRFARLEIGVVILAYVLTAFELPQAGGVLNHLLFSACSCAVLMLTLVLEPKQLSSPYPFPWLAWLGKVSYGTYLFHYGILVLAFHFLARKKPVLGSVEDVLITIVALIATLFIVFVLHKLIEAPMIRRGKGLSDRIGNVFSGDASGQPARRT